MTPKQKDLALLEEAYKLISEAKAGKCTKCGCNPLKPKAGCKCKHKMASKKEAVDEEIDTEESDTLEEKENKKPDWLVKAQKKSEGKGDSEDKDEDSDDDEDSDKEDKVSEEQTQLDESFNPRITSKATRQALEDLYTRMSKRG